LAAWAEDGGGADPYPDRATIRTQVTLFVYSTGQLVSGNLIEQTGGLFDILGIRDVTNLLAKQFTFGVSGNLAERAVDLDHPAARIGKD
jgi:hypothetical protein